MSDLSEFIGGSGAKLWSSGMTVRQWQSVTSPLDGDVYRRTTATGAGATDPANDLTNYIAVTYRRVSSLASPSTPPLGASGITTGFPPSGVTIAAPTLTAGVRTQVLSLTGRGAVRMLGSFYSVNNTNGTGDMRHEVIVDGRTILDFSGPHNVAYAYYCLIGGLTGASPAIPMMFESVQFRRTFEMYATPAAVSGALPFRQFFYSYSGEA